DPWGKELAQESHLVHDIADDRGKHLAPAQVKQFLVRVPGWHHPSSQRTYHTRMWRHYRQPGAFPPASGAGPVRDRDAVPGPWRGGRRGAALPGAEGTPAAGQVVGRKLDHDAITGENADEVLAHFAAEVAEDGVPVLKLDGEHGVWQRIHHPAVDRNRV